MNGNAFQPLVGLESSQDLVTVQARHQDIQQDQVRKALRDALERRFTAAGLLYLVPLILQPIAEHSHVSGNVVHYEDPWSVGHPPPSSLIARQARSFSTISNNALGWNGLDT